MQIKSFKQVCNNPRLHDLLAVSRRDKVRSSDFAQKLLNTKQEELFRLFLAGVYENRNSERRGDAKRLFRAFSKQFEHLSETEKRQFTDSFHKEVQKVSSVFIRKTTSLDGRFEDATFALKDLKHLLKKLRERDYKLAAKQEAEVNRYSIKQDHIRDGLREFQDLNDRDYPHSVIQLDNSPKMVIIGTPRHDRENTLNRFFSIMIDEKVDVIIALNTASDWEGAIPYHEVDHVESIAIEGYTITVNEANTLYEGHVAANFPEKVKKTLEDMSETEREEKLRSRKLKEYRPRVIERVFDITNTRTGRTRKLTQLHYENWPDRQAAPDLDAWWILLRRHLELQKGTIAIHCQGGIGRTNAYAILTCLVSEINALYESKADLANATFNVPLTMLLLKEQAPRLGGLVCGKRFAQIYEMLYRYYIEMSALEEKSVSD